MRLFGAHMSTAGGVHNALLTAGKYKCGTVQLFTKNNNQWMGKALTPEMAANFKRLTSELNLQKPTSHVSYLINMATSVEVLWQKSIDAMVDEMNRAEMLGIDYLVVHPGAHVGAGEEVGLAQVIKAVDEIHARCPEHRVQILLELTAGQGSCLGHRFEHLATILQGAKNSDRLGVCFDTCHVFAGGYSLAPEPIYTQTMAEFDRLIGLSKLKVFHFNDSKKPLGSRVDRHEHIGQGHLGLEPFRLLVNDPRFEQIPMILETPKTNDLKEEMDPVNLGVLRGLLKK
jgi:deoxyribonuclease-4